MKPIVWSRMKSGLLNGKVGNVTFFTIGNNPDDAFDNPWGGPYVLAPKLPGLKTVKVVTEDNGKSVADTLYREFLEAIGVLPWSARREKGGQNGE